MKQHEMSFGADWAINNNLGFETRYTRKRLDRTIEDAGYLDASGSEPFFIVNPGEGIDKFGNVPLTDCPVGECKQQPKAIRDYDSVEFRLTKKASDKWFGVLSYTYSRLWGNYGGLTSAEVADGGTSFAAGGGRLSPNVSRSFDEPIMQFDAHGNQTMGLLPTDRPHTVKAYGYYKMKWMNMETLLGATQFVYSGTPLSSYINASNNSGVPIFPEGRAKWVDMHLQLVNNNPSCVDNEDNIVPCYDLVVDGIRDRRTPVFSQTDMNLVHEIKVSKNNERMRLAFEANVVNLFNQHAAVSYASSIIDDTTYIDPSLHTPASSASGFDYPTFLKYGMDWVKEFNSEALVGSRAYGTPNSFQGGRTFRFKVRFSF
jgi:hypothetical protein